MDPLFELDKWIEEHVYDRFEPTISVEDPICGVVLGWERNEDGRYSYWDYQYEGRSYYVSEFWPRRFSTNTLLSVELAKRFRISIKCVVTRGALSGFEVESWLMPGLTVEKESLEEAICLLVVMLTKNMDAKDV